MPNFDPAHEELEHVAGDDPDRSSSMGSFDLTQGKLGSVRVRYGDQMVFCEVYQHPGEPMQLHWKCPRCLSGGPNHMTRITGDRKKIDYDPRAQLDDGGRLNVEAFECPWDLGYVQAGGPRRQDHGIGMCKLTIEIANSVARDA
jgi:hypothetical protein